MSTNVLAEIEGIMEVLDLSLGSTAQYGESLQGPLASTSTGRASTGPACARSWPPS